MGNPTIAVIDDDDAFLTLMRDVYAGEGYDVVTGNLAENARALIARVHPDVVMLDVRMETPDAGLMLLRALRSETTTMQIPVLVCTADARFLQLHEAELRALRAETIIKPFDLDDLLGVVAALIQTRPQGGAGSAR